MQGQVVEVEDRQGQTEASRRSPELQRDIGAQRRSRARLHKDLDTRQSRTEPQRDKGGLPRAQYSADP